MSREAEKSRCGCCGRERVLPGGKWCEDCRPHVLHDWQPAWGSTYFAIHKKNCPFEPVPRQHARLPAADNASGVKS